jgi:hypothetical protein
MIRRVADDPRQANAHPAAVTEPWAPFGIADAMQLLAGAPFWWAIAGGWAIDLFLGTQTRPHGDLDIAVARRDHAQIFETLGPRWECHVAARGTLSPWHGDGLEGANSVWCRAPGERAWRFELVMTELQDGDWVFRRDARIRLRLDEAILSGAPPYVAPHVQLLFKARHRAAKDDADLARVLPALTPARRRWLQEALCMTEGPDHPWVAFIQAPGP